MDAKRVALYKEVFVHRTDAYMHNTGFGWNPVRDCGQDRPFGDGQVLSHIEGRCRCGLYAMKPAPENTCKWVVADFDDNAQAFEQAWALAHHLESQELFPLVERSFSGKGYHVWLFFEEPVKAKDARTLMLNALVEANIPIQGTQGKGKNTQRSFDRLFPSQDETNAYGNIIALPLHGEALKQGNCAFIDRQGQPYPDQWAKVAEILEKRVPTSHPLLYGERANIPGIRRVRATDFCDSDNSFALLKELPDHLNQIRECEAIKTSLTNPNAFNNSTWTGILSNIAVFESKGQDLAHEVSRGYDMRVVNQNPAHVYSEEETDRAYFHKVDYIQKIGTPASCRWLSEKGWTCPKLEYCPYKFIAMYGAPPSLTLYNTELTLSNDDRKKLMDWEQTAGYQSIFDLFPTDATYAVYKDGKLTEIRRKEYWCLCHLLGTVKLYVRYPSFKNTVRSIWYDLSNQMDADRFAQDLTENEVMYDRSDTSFWILRDGAEITLDVAMKVLEHLAVEAGIELTETWSDVIFLKTQKEELFHPLPYFSKLKTTLLEGGTSQ